MTRVFLALSGKAHHGKDTVANAIFHAFPGQVKVYSISELICDELGLRRSDVKDVRALQAHSHARCAKDPLYWARQIQTRAAAGSERISILTNVRREDEAHFYIANGWRLCRVIALNPDGSLYMASDRNQNDPLETQLDRFNFEFRIIARKPGYLRLLEAQAVALAMYLTEGEQKEDEREPLSGK